MAMLSRILRRGVLVLAALSILTLAGCKTEVFQGLTENQANDMLTLMLKHGIPATKESSKAGYTLLVESNRVVQALELMRENSLPRESYDTLGKVFAAQGMISSATEEQARLAYALSQELSNTYSRIDGVLTARVHVVLSTTDLGTGKITPASAAVFLRHTPTSQAVHSVSMIRELAANAVPGLTQDRVSVMLIPVRDTLSVPQPAQPASATASALKNWQFYALGAAIVFFLTSIAGTVGCLLLYLRARRNGKDQEDADKRPAQKPRA